MLARCNVHETRRPLQEVLHLVDVIDRGARQIDHEQYVTLAAAEAQRFQLVSVRDEMLVEMVEWFDARTKHEYCREKK